MGEGERATPSIPRRRVTYTLLWDFDDVTAVHYAAFICVVPSQRAERRSVCILMIKYRGENMRMTPLRTPRVR